jgi:hypothetical protein
MSLEDKKTKAQRDYTITSNTSVFKNSTSTTRGFVGLTDKIAVSSGGREEIPAAKNQKLTITGDAATVLGFQVVSQWANSRIVFNATGVGINKLMNAVDQRVGAYASIDDLIEDIDDKIPAADVSSIRSGSSTGACTDGNFIGAVLTDLNGQEVYQNAVDLPTTINDLTSEALVQTQKAGQSETENPYRLTTSTGFSVFDAPYQIGANVAEWNVADKNTIEFSYITSAEELRAELLGITREITGVIVHWTKTFTDMNIGSEELNKDKDGGMEYHYVIRRDGSLQRGRPSGIESNHTTQRNHNKKSLGIAFVGGYNCPTNTENADKFLSVKSLTQAQFNTFEKFCKEFYLKYPGGQILGHNAIDTNYEDPGFDVSNYVENIFNKKSLYTNPTTDTAFEPNQIITTELP